ncbi:MAG: hypothetical protein QXU98_07950 [Candidatus Parvarchaeota archaeon]
MTQEVKNPIIKIGEVIGKEGLKMRFEGIYRKIGAFGPSYLLFADNKAYSVTGLASRQLENYYSTLQNAEFSIEFKKFKSKKYGKEGIAIKKIIIHKHGINNKQVELIDETQEGKNE